MPGAEKKTRKEKAAVAAKGRAAPGVNKYMPDQSRNAHASIAASSGAQKLLKRAALLQTLLARKESAETRILI